MIVRSAALLAALALFVTPAFAQGTGDAPLSSEETAPAADGAEPAAEDAADAEPAPGAARALAPMPPAVAPAPVGQPLFVASPFSPDQRNGWLAQCRVVFQRAGAALGGGGLPDACETQLIDFERSYVAPAGGQATVQPVIMVRVPIVRQPPLPEPDPVSEDEPLEE